MTIAELQQYLDDEKWHESEAKGYDMCGNYPRCEYCDRKIANPCAIAHGKWIVAEATPAQEPTVEAMEEEVAISDATQEPAEKSGRVRVLTIARKREVR